MADFFDNYIFLIIIGVLIVLVFLLVCLFVFKKRKKNVVINEVKEFSSVPEFDQISSSNEVKPFSEQDFNRQLMSQVQGVSVSQDSVDQSIDSVSELNSDVLVQSDVQSQSLNQENIVMPNLVPEFGSGTVNQSVVMNNEFIDKSVSNLVSDGNSSIQSEGQIQFIPQPDIFGPGPVNSNSSSMNSDVEAIDIVDDSQDDVVDVLEPIDEGVSNNKIDVVDFNSVFGQSSNGSNQ